MLSETLLEMLRTGVTGVTSVQSSIDAPSGCYIPAPEGVTDVTGNGSTPDSITPVTPCNTTDVTAKTSPSAGCTPITSVTPKIINGHNECANPMLTLRQFTEVQSQTWDDATIELNLECYRQARKGGVEDEPAYWWAEFATWRDVHRPDMHFCIECQHYNHYRGLLHGHCSRPRNPPALMGGLQIFWQLRRCGDFLKRKGSKND